MSDICTHCGERVQPGAIIVAMWPEESTRTSQQACYYTAVAVVGGQEYRGRSRHGASYDLARIMLAAAVPDAPFHIHQVQDPERLDRPGGLRGHLAYRSFHEAAQWMIAESERRGPTRVRWRPSPDLRAVFSDVRGAEKQGGNDLPAPPLAAED